MNAQTLLETVAQRPTSPATDTRALRGSMEDLWGSPRGSDLRICTVANPASVTAGHQQMISIHIGDPASSSYLIP